MPDDIIPQPTPTPEPTPTPPASRPLWLRLLPTNWRAIVAWGVMALATAGLNYLRGPNVDPLPIPPPPTPIFPDGWIKPTEEDRREALALKNVWQFSDTEAGQAVVGGDEDAPVYRFYAKLHGKTVPSRNQGQLGSCVSFGFAGAVEMSLAAQAILKRGPPQVAVPAVVQEVIYGGSRVEVNGGRVPFNGDGSTGAWAVKWLSTGGIVSRGKYGSLDLSEYSVSRCRTWGNQGVPTEIKPEAIKNLCTYALVKNSTEARAALQQGYPIAVCSGVGFDSNKDQNGKPTRDAEGFLAPAGSWGHCMYIAAYRGGARPGFLIVNSWGPDWVTGPKGSFSDIPDGSFWAAPSAVDRILREEDSYAISGVGGFKKAKIDANEWIIQHRDNRPWRIDREAFVFAR